MKELQMFEIMREIVTFGLFVWVLLTLSYSFRDPNAFLLQNHMQQMLIKNTEAGIDYTKVS